LTPQQFGERFNKLQQIAEARDVKQQAALVSSLRMFPKTLSLLPDTVQVKVTALKQQLEQQLGMDPKQTQQLISKQPEVLAHRADSLIRKATEQGQLLDLEAADVVRFWTSHRQLIRASTQLLHAKLAQLQLLLQPYMSQADVRQLVLVHLDLLTGHTTAAVSARLEALQECLTDWSPQQLGAALLSYASVLTLSPKTIRDKWRIASQYRDMYMLGTPMQQEQQQQEQEQPPQASELGLFKCPAERYAVLEYILTEQQQQQQQRQRKLHLNVNSTGSSVSNSSQGLESSSDGGAHITGSYMPPMMTALRTSKRLLDPLLQQHYPGFWQWYKQRQQAAKTRGQQPG
jgi:hypothetical protein